ncbi:aldehyde dehydrogenase family protein [Marinobacterium sedimentorum]|uniref:aldehyde dehydrogenase family protein n=1 Tax=Marinobacterium sedimentorum TaxID=2927804 RepID=UPI0020C63FE7|nr:aldehyde dehydrogenase family protein [Marinobacterium sedimentorum]MCP8689070.1 aldehyde dehydrogenase family protein [Marinobacterium sedimentorum]
MTIREIPLFIDGKAVRSASADWHQVRNPATRRVVVRVPCATQADVDRAVASAKTAFAVWRRVADAHHAAVAGPHPAEQGKTPTAGRWCRRQRGSSGKQAIQFCTQTKTVRSRRFEPEHESAGINTTILL